MTTIWFNRHEMNILSSLTKFINENKIEMGKKEYHNLIGVFEEKKLSNQSLIKHMTENA